MPRRSEVLCILLLGTTYEAVKSLNCPISEREWKRASNNSQCQDPNYYHCLRDETGAMTEQCISPILIQPKKCPEFNQRVSKIDVSGCSRPGCPVSAYTSNTVFMYPICFENISAPSPTKTQPTVDTTTFHEISSNKTTLGSLENHEDESLTESLPLGAIVGITVGAILICLVGGVLIILVLKRRRRDISTSKEEQADGNVRSEVSKPPEKVEKGTEINETSNLLSIESSSESKESVTVGSKVYVVENKKPNEQRSVPKDESSVRVLVLVLNKPINNVEMNSKAKETFGKNYNYCWTLSYHQKHRQKESVSLFPQNFDFERVKEICERIRDVGLERDVNFVITVPLSVWSAQRDELSSFLNEDKNLCFKREYW